MRAFGQPTEGRPVVLDFGCGAGGLVAALRSNGAEAYGTDFASRLGDSPHLAALETEPYRLPYPDGRFDFVVSTAVMEHAQDIEACYREVHRVLKPGGVAMHLFPAKWYLPTEPHVHVPLASWFWPRQQRTWLALWALLGVRASDQAGQGWREVMTANHRYLRDHCSYLSTRRHTAESMRVFGNCSWPATFFIERTPGGVGRLGRRLRARALTGLLSRELRTAFLVQRKAAT